MENQYLFDGIENSKQYRNRLVEVLRHNSNIEVGGYRFYDGTGTHMLQNPIELADLIIWLKEVEWRKKRNLTRSSKLVLLLV